MAKMKKEPFFIWLLYLQLDDTFDIIYGEAPKMYRIKQTKPKYQK